MWIYNGLSFPVGLYWRRSFRKAPMTVQQYWSFSGYKEDRLTLIYTRFKKVLDKINIPVAVFFVRRA